MFKQASEGSFGNVDQETKTTVIGENAQIVENLTSSETLNSMLQNFSFVNESEMKISNVDMSCATSCPRSPIFGGGAVPGSVGIENNQSMMIDIIAENSAKTWGQQTIDSLADAGITAEVSVESDQSAKDSGAVLADMINDLAKTLALGLMGPWIIGGVVVICCIFCCVMLFKIFAGANKNTKNAVGAGVSRAYAKQYCSSTNGSYNWSTNE